MLNSAVIVFREFFEISLMLSIVIFAVSNIPNYKKYVYSGVLSGVLSSLIAAVLFYKLKTLFSGIGQEYINLFILCLVVVLIIYTVVWIELHSKNYAKKIKSNSIDIHNGKKPLYAISIIIASSMIREGMEIILFLSGVHAAGSSIFNVVCGFLVGAFLGLGAGAILYFGLFKISHRFVFKITKAMLILIAASMSSQIGNLLSSANIVSFGGTPLWNSEWLITENSLIGKILFSLVGYHSSPTLLEVIFWLSGIAIIFIFQKIAIK